MKPVEKRCCIGTAVWLAWCAFIWIFASKWGQPDDWTLLAIASGMVFCGLLLWVFWLRSITLILIVSLIALPMESRGSQVKANAKDSIMFVCGCLVLLGGAVIIWQLYKMCKKLPPIQEPDPETNAPPAPTVPPNWTNITMLPSGAMSVSLVDTDIKYRLIQNPIPPDTNGPAAAPWTLLSAVDFLVSSNMLDWHCVLTYTNWISPLGAEFVFLTNGVPFLTNYCPVRSGSYSNIIPFELLDRRERSQFLRVQNHQ